VRAHEEQLERERHDALPENVKAAMAERERVAKLEHKPFDLPSLQREFGQLSKERRHEAPFPKHHINFQARPDDGMHRRPRPLHG
jgi:hypothetical protein